MLITNSVDNVTHTVGQGKSLSLICGSLTWLRDHQQREFENGLDWDANGAFHPKRETHPLTCIRYKGAPMADRSDKSSQKKRDAPSTRSAAGET